MDMIKIGEFLRNLRKEHNLTQEQLGEEIGVTNKTISRWENGIYLPPVEMLQILSKKYDVTLNEILCGERLDTSSFKQKAEENILVTLNNSVFTMNDKISYFKKKWMKEHAFELVLEIIAIIALAVCGIIFNNGLSMAAMGFTVAWVALINNRMHGYIEMHLYNEQNTSVKNDITNEE